MPSKLVDEVVFCELNKTRTSEEERKHILDGYPRDAEQAKSLVKHEMNRCGKTQIDVVIVMDITKSEILKRLSLRGRMEDNPETISYRMKVYEDMIALITGYFDSINVSVVHVNGVGSVGEVHDRIEKVLEELKIVGDF